MQDRGGVLWVGTYVGANSWNYLSDAFTYFMYRRLVSLPSLTMPNLIAGDPIVPEFLQDEATPEAIARAMGWAAWKNLNSTSRPASAK